MSTKDFTFKELQNEYGTLEVITRSDGTSYIHLAGACCDSELDIPPYLYKALKKFHKELKEKINE